MGEGSLKSPDENNQPIILLILCVLATVYNQLLSMYIFSGKVNYVHFSKLHYTWNSGRVMSFDQPLTNEIDGRTAHAVSSLD
jgi:hypothetical protein